MFVPSFKLNDRVLKVGRVNPITGTVAGINPSADVFQVVWDGIGTADPAWYTAQSLKLDKPEYPGYKMARDRAAEAKRTLDKWKMMPVTYKIVVGDSVHVLVEMHEGNSTDYTIRRGSVTASVAYGCSLVVLTDDNEYISAISSNVKRIQRGF